MDCCRRADEGRSSAAGRQSAVAAAAIPGRRATLLTALLVSLAAVSAHLPALNCGFVNWDDNLYVSGNPLVQRLNAAFLHGAFLEFTAGNWHPLTMFSHALDYALWGVNPFGHHLTSLLLHTVNTFLAVLVVERLGRSPGWRSGALSDPTTARGEAGVLLAAGLTGLLFGLHPLHVESVAWISERKDLLCAMFYLLSVLAYAAYATDAEDAAARGSRFLRDRRYLGALVLFGLALMSKPMAVSLPAVLLILDYCPFGRVRNGAAFGAAAIEKLPFFLPALAVSVLTFLAQRNSHAVVSLEAMPYAERLTVAVRSIGFYLEKMLLPVNLLPFYVPPRRTSLELAATGLSAAVVIGATLAAIVAARRGRRFWLAAWCWYGLTLAPVLGVVQVGGQVMADRYTYLPSLGPFLILGTAVTWSWGRIGALRRGNVAARAALCAAVVGALSVLAVLTVRQTAIWRDSVTLWSALIAREPRQPGFVYYNRASAYQESGKFPEALVDYGKAIERDPKDGEFYFGRAYVLGKSRRWPEALADYGKAIELSPGDRRLFESRGRLLAGTGQIAAAAADFASACRLGSDFGCTAAQFYRTAGAKLLRR